jgi:osmotically-inducible protein OsmY
MGIFSNVKTMVEQVLVNNPQTNQYKIDVVEKSGIVTLKGTVDSMKARETIGRIVSELSGVIQVVNALEVSKDEKIVT